jgi:hypothetical protein
MMGAKHTPGRWILCGTEVHDRETHLDEHGARIGETPNIIAKTYYTPTESYDGINGTLVQHSNARLIAAAPDLLAACEEMLRTLTAPSRKLSTVTRRELDPWVSMLRAAVVKAKGEPRP